MKRATLEAILAHRRERRACVLCTHLPTGAQQLIELEHPASGTPELHAAAQRAAARDSSVCVELPEGPHLLHVFNPALRMLIIGAVHIAQSLVPFARAHGFDVTVIDPRRAFASPARFEGVRIVHAWPERALLEMKLDRRCAVITLTHDPKLDDPALRAALGCDAFYVGALGSRRTHQARLQRLAEQGVPAAQLERIRGPVGLDIGAVGAAEIATSIMADVIQHLRRGPA